MTSRRCICGRSQTFPICDGAHGSQNWSCTPSSHVEKVVIACPHYHSFAEWLAHQNQGMAAHQQKPDSCDELIMIYDGCDINMIQQQIVQLPHRKQRWIHVHDFLPDALQFSDNHQHFHIDATKLNIQDFSWSQALPIKRYRPSKQSIFASHAVLDEAILTPCIEKIQQHYHPNLFFCRNSIQLGTLWQEQIQQKLEQSEIIWAFVSKNFCQSTFCAFEIGYAKALKKPIIPIVIDHAPIPAYIQEYNALYYERHKMLQPWLNPEELILDMCLTTLSQSVVDSKAFVASED